MNIIVIMKKLETSVFQVFLLPKICFLIALLFFAEAFFVMKKCKILLDKIDTHVYYYNRHMCRLLEGW